MHLGVLKICGRTIPLWPLFRGCLSLAILTYAGLRFNLNSATVGFLYLVAVVLNCLNGSMISSIVLSIVAAGCLDYFFTEPLFTLTVASPVDIAALAAFLTSSLVVSRLASKAREEARASLRDRQYLNQLYQLSQRLISLDPLSLDRSQLLDAMLAVFNLQGAAWFDAATARTYLAGTASDGLSDQTRQAYFSGRDFNDGNRQLAFRQLRSGRKSLGAIGLEGPEDPRAIAGPAAALAAAGVERAMAALDASRMAAETHTETLRTAILDAIAHEFKTPLATILTAAGGIQETGPLTPGQAELARIVEDETARLSELSSRLIRLTRLDRDEIRTRLQPVEILPLVSSAINRYAESTGREFVLSQNDASSEVMADPELYGLALSQLLDNASRYSPPQSTVRVTVGPHEGLTAVTVWNDGAPIPTSEHARIFERFYRGEAVRHRMSGTGLGLYVARKIALAHGGRLELAPSESASGVAFRLSIPIAAEEFSHELRTDQCISCR